MEEKCAVEIPLSAELTAGLHPFMKLTCKREVSEFLREAINFSLRKQGEEPLPSDSCLARDDYVSFINEEGIRHQVFAAILEFRGSAERAVQHMRYEKKDPHGIDWVMDSMQEYAAALVHLLPPEEKIRRFHHATQAPKVSNLH